MKKLLGLTLIVLGLITAVLALQAPQVANATQDVPWGQCEQLRCGSSEGTQSREVSHYECPQGYNPFIGNSCIRIYPFNITSKILVTETETQSCQVEEPYACEEEVCPPGTHEVEQPKNELWVEEEYKLVCEPDGPPGNPPTFAGSSTEAPVCPNGSTTNVVANPHVIRNGSQATVNFFITEGDSANIYYSVVGQPHWQHSVSDVKPNGDKFVSVVITGLDPALGYDFGIQQKQGCGGGKTTAVVVDGPGDRLYQFSYWE